MVEESKTARYLEEIANLRYANVAKRMTSDASTAPYAIGALEKMVSDIKKALGDKSYLVEGAFAGTFVSEDGRNIATAIYSQLHDEALGNLNFSEFYDLRLKELTSMLGKEKAEKAKDAFAKYGNQTVGSIMEKYEQAQEILGSKSNLYDKKKKEEAKETKEKWENLYNIITGVELWNYWKLMPDAAKGPLGKTVSESIDKIA